MSDACASTRSPRPARSVLVTLRVLVIVLLATTVALAIVAVVALRSARSGLDRRVNDLVPTYLETRDLYRQLSTTNSELLAALHLGDLAAFQDLAGAQEAADEIERRLAETLLDSPNAELYEAHQIAVDRWWGYVDDILNGRTAGATDAIDGLAGRFEVVAAANDALVVTLKRDLDEDWRRSGQRLDRDTWLIVIGSGAASIIAAVVARRVARSVSDPVRGLASVAAQIRRGDVGATADEHTGSAEVRALAKAFNELNVDRDQAITVREMSLDIAVLLRQAESEEAGLVAMCARLGAALEADRCDIFTGGVDEAWSLQYGWRREGAGELPEIDLPSLDFLTQVVNSPSAPVGLEVRVITDAAAPDTVGGEIGQAIARSFHYRAVVSAPIVLDGRMLGVLFVRMDDTPRAWTDAEIYAVRQAGELATQAIAEREYVASLHALDRQKSEFLATASHELRTPLTSIAGYLELLDDGDLGQLTPAQDKAVAVIRRNTVRLRGLIEDILVLNRIEERGLVASFAALDLDDLVGRVCEVLQPIADDGGVTLDCQPTESAVMINGVGDQLERALTNVFGNAIKFTPRGGRVSVRSSIAGPDGELVRIVCDDTGVGIPAADLANLSTRFFRASNATSMAIPGTGLGLAIVRSIIELHGGSLGIDSEEGAGTTVTLTLPRSLARPE